jgi:hypothetical protein
VRDGRRRFADLPPRVVRHPPLKGEGRIAFRRSGVG